MKTVHTMDLTKGSLYRGFIKLAIPLILGNILQQFYNTIDAFVVGRFAGQEEFAAIGVAGTVMNLFLFAIVGACNGLSVLFAQCYGEENHVGLRRQHFTALISGLSVSVLLCLIGMLGTHDILKWMQTPDELNRYVTVYLRWIFISLPAAFIYNMYACALRASGDTAAALYILVASILANLGLDILFVAQWGKGIEGAAEATALTQCLSAVFCLIYLLHSHRELLVTKQDCVIKKQLLGKTLRCSCVTALHQTGLYIGKIMIQGAVNAAGTEVIAAYTAATRIEGFANSFGDSGSAATSVLVAQNFGAKDYRRTEKAFRTGLRLMTAVGILSAVILFISAPLTIRWMLGNPTGISFAEAVKYLRLIAVFYPLCFTGGTFTGYYNGIGKVILTFAGTMGQITLRVALTWIFFHKWQLCTVAVATGIGWLMANLFWASRKKKLP